MSKKLWNLFGRGTAEGNPALAAYSQYRPVGTALNQKLIEYGVDHAALAASARALGMKGAGRQLILESEGEMPVLMDYAIYEYRREGQNIVTRYQAAVGGADPIERELLAAMLTATTALFRVEGVSRAARLIHLRDLTQANRSLDLTDVAFSRTLTADYVLFLRPVVLSTLAMTSGFSLVFPARIEADLLRRWRSPASDARGATLSAKRYASFFKLSRRQGIETRYEDAK